MVQVALTKLGGVQYLVDIGKSEPGHFFKLLSMIIPREVSHSGVITGVSVTVNTNLAMGNNARAKKALLANVAHQLAEESAVYEGACVDAD
jgi:hypothetical protein